MNEAGVLERLGQFCLAMPEVTERLNHGSPAWYVRGKIFLRRGRSGAGPSGRFGMWCAAAEGMQQVLVENEPDLFFLPAYVGGRGWIGMYLDLQPLDWDRVSEVVEDAYRAVAPKRLVVQLDACD